MHELQYILQWIWCGCADGLWGKQNREAWRHMAQTKLMPSEADELATRLHGTGVSYSSSHGHHRTEVGRHIALILEFAAEANQLATRLHRTGVMSSDDTHRSSGSHCHNWTEIGRQIVFQVGAGKLPSLADCECFGLICGHGASEDAESQKGQNMLRPIGPTKVMYEQMQIVDVQAGDTQVVMPHKTQSHDVGRSLASLLP